ncbi:solute symporter family transporter [Roridomyces roridus]|uniref:Solute symporter family transporter n=1 Tax=Roridomyces roridus TaxID=1738132 RepID=A0AAD7BKK8_9AGAR|nr:solute symporter family transporter [Roridomyces roridus]
MSLVGEKEFTRLLNQGHGYGIVVGLGFAFAALMVFLTWVQKRFTNMNPSAASEFATASRSIKAGLVCCGITSAWTWSATLLQSSTATYQSGLSTAWWYAVGGTIQIAIFSMIAAKVKMNANGATTFLQIVKARFGVPSHLLFTFYALVCVHVVCGSLILGASATVNALTGMSIIACNFLLPIGIAVYVIAGGLRATFICDFIHTTILFVIIYIFVFTAYGSSDVLGSPGQMWDLLQQAAVTHPVAGNAAGSYTTMRSNSGVIFAAVTIAAGFSGVFCDQGYWQRAIASRPESTTKAYMLGALSWFSIPWAFGTVMGLGARALETNPKFPTYPYALSAAQQSAGLVAPAAAVTMLGKGGAVAVLLVTFMAATSAASAELIAVSSIIVYDIMGTYWKPLSGKQVIFYSHFIIGVWAIWMGVWATILNKVGIDLGWLFYIQGVALTPAVVPIGLTVCWNRLSATAAFYGTLFGTVCGMLGWMIGCWKIYGTINVTNLALPYSAVSGAAPGLVLSTSATLILAWIFPDDYDWGTTRAISSASQGEDSQTSSVDEKAGAADSSDADKKDLAQDTVEEVVATPAPLDREQLQRVFVRAAWISLTLTFIVTILIPMSMFGQSYVFSRKFFTGWVAISIIWVLLAGAFCIILPIWESRTEIRLIVSGLTGMRSKNESTV